MKLKKFIGDYECLIFTYLCHFENHGNIEKEKGKTDLFEFALDIKSFSYLWSFTL